MSLFLALGAYPHMLFAMKILRERLVSCLRRLADQPLLLLFSAGFDSSALLGAASAYGLPIQALWLDNGLNRVSFDRVAQQAKNLGAAGAVKRLEVPLTADVLQNSRQRCFFCARGYLDTVERAFPRRRLLEGSNADDAGTFRPGMTAKKRRVVSPLMTLGIGREDAQRMALFYGANADIAAYESCLASRFRYGQPLLPTAVQAIRAMEAAIIGQTRDFSVRCRFDDLLHLRIECAMETTGKLLAPSDLRGFIIAQAKKICQTVAVDLEGSRPNVFDDVEEP